MMSYIINILTNTHYSIQVIDHWAPPIYLENIGNYSAFNTVLTTITSSDSFTCETLLLSSYFIVQPTGRSNLNKIFEHSN